MKKNTIKAFTLVEMLIVIVIIGILIAALMPRMQAAQGRARDVSRKTALSQIQSAIVVSQGDKGQWPGMDITSGSKATDGIDISAIEDALKSAGMNSIPSDPLGTTQFYGIGESQGEPGQYRYIVTTRNGTPNGGFVLMAKTEVEGGSNWVVCGSGSNADGTIKSTTDLGKDVLTCENSISEGDTCSNSGGNCVYSNSSELRYIVLY